MEANEDSDWKQLYWMCESKHLKSHCVGSQHLVLYCATLWVWLLWMTIRVSYLIAGADVHSSFQIFQNFVDVSCPRRSQETGVAVRLEETQRKYVITWFIHDLVATHPLHSLFSYLSMKYYVLNLKLRSWCLLKKKKSTFKSYPSKPRY